MKFLIALLFFVSSFAQAETVTSEKIHTALDSLEQQLGRALTADEVEGIGNMLLAEKEAADPLQKISVSEEQDARLNLACLKGQVAPFAGMGGGAMCIGDDFKIYGFLMGQFDSTGGDISLSVAYVRISGPKAYNLLTNTVDENEFYAPFNLTGVGASAHFIGGGDLAHFSSPNGSKITIVGVGVGIGASGAGYANQPVLFAIGRFFSSALPRYKLATPVEKQKNELRL